MALILDTNFLVNLEREKLATGDSKRRRIQANFELACADLLRSQPSLSLDFRNGSFQNIEREVEFLF